jgi:P27 family predicted phage terminase small subunit
MAEREWLTVKKFAEWYRLGKDLVYKLCGQRIPSPPDDLGEVGAKEWRRLGPALRRRGLLTNTDLTAFHMYCATYERWVLYSREAKKNPLIATPNGMVLPSPYVSMANRALCLLRKSLARFGMTAASRARSSGKPAGLVDLQIVLNAKDEASRLVEMAEDEDLGDVP